MNWFKVWGSGLQTNPKWLALTMEERGAWITIMTIACALQPPWSFRSAEHASLLLGREGAADPDALIGRLVQVGLMDLPQDGSVEVHDHADWQKYPSDAPAATRARQRRSRAAKAVPPIVELMVTSRHEPVTNRHEASDQRALVERDTDSDTQERGFTARMIGAGLSPELAKTLGIDHPEA